MNCWPPNSGSRIRGGAIEGRRGRPVDLLNAQLELANTQLTQLDNQAKLQAAFGALEDTVQSPMTLSRAALDAAANGIAHDPK